MATLSMDWVNSLSQHVCEYMVSWRLWTQWKPLISQAEVISWSLERNGSLLANTNFLRWNIPKSPKLLFCFWISTLRIQDVDYSLENNFLLKTVLSSDLEMLLLKVSFLWTKSNRPSNRKRKDGLFTFP